MHYKNTNVFIQLVFSLIYLGKINFLQETETNITNLLNVIHLDM